MLLEVENLRVVFGGLVAVSDVSCNVEQGSVFGIIGPNGAGKSTFFNALSGVAPTQGGTVHLNGVDLGRLAAYQRVKEGVARTFQAAQLFPSMTVVDNVRAARHNFTCRSVVHSVFRTGRLRSSESVETRKALEILDRVRLHDSANWPTSRLTIIQRQQLAVALALATEPILLMLDEPLAGLAHGDVNEFTQLLRQLRDDGITLVVIEHRLRALMAMCDRIMVLDKGAKISEGTPEEIRVDEHVIRAYLGATYAA
jgi:branched-chain amino acid transport system ATP-binding protein